MDEGLSVIIPTLNEEKSIGDLLTCLTRQDFKNFEVIIVDGKSKDHTEQKVRNFNKKIKNLRFIKANKKNQWYQRNLGVKNANYDSLLFLDADTTFEKFFLEDSLNQINKKKFSIATPLYAPSLPLWHYSIMFFLINSHIRLFGRIAPLGCSACLFSNKRLHEQIGGFNEDSSYINDHKYIYNSKKQFKIGPIKTRFKYSVRRFEEEGTKKTMWLWMRVGYNFLFKKEDITKNTNITFGGYR